MGFIFEHNRQKGRGHSQIYEFFTDLGLFIAEVTRYYLAGLILCYFMYVCFKKWCNGRNINGFSIGTFPSGYNHRPTDGYSGGESSEDSDSQLLEDDDKCCTECSHCNKPLVNAVQCNTCLHHTKTDYLCYENPPDPFGVTTSVSTQKKILTCNKQLSTTDLTPKPSRASPVITQYSCTSNKQLSTTDLQDCTDKERKTDITPCYFKDRPSPLNNGITIIITTADRQISTSDLNPCAAPRETFSKVGGQTACNCNKLQDTSDLVSGRDVDKFTSTTELDRYFSRIRYPQVQVVDRQISAIDFESVIEPSPSVDGNLSRTTFVDKPRKAVFIRKGAKQSSSASLYGPSDDIVMGIQKDSKVGPGILKKSETPYRYSQAPSESRTKSQKRSRRQRRITSFERLPDEQEVFSPQYKQNWSNSPIISQRPSSFEYASQDNRLQPLMTSQRPTSFQRKTIDEQQISPGIQKMSNVEERLMSWDKEPSRVISEVIEEEMIPSRFTNSSFKRSATTSMGTPYYDYSPSNDRSSLPTEGLSEIMEEPIRSQRSSSFQGRSYDQQNLPPILHKSTYFEENSFSPSRQLSDSVNRPSDGRRVVSSKLETRSWTDSIDPRTVSQRPNSFRPGSLEENTFPSQVFDSRETSHKTSSFRYGSENERAYRTEDRIDSRAPSQKPPSFKYASQDSVFRHADRMDSRGPSQKPSSSQYGLLDDRTFRSADMPDFRAPSQKLPSFQYDSQDSAFPYADRMDSRAPSQKPPSFQYGSEDDRIFPSADTPDFRSSSQKPSSFQYDSQDSAFPYAGRIDSRAPSQKPSSFQYDSQDSASRSSKRMEDQSESWGRQKSQQDSRFRPAYESTMQGSSYETSGLTSTQGSFTPQRTNRIENDPYNGTNVSSSLEETVIESEILPQRPSSVQYRPSSTRNVSQRRSKKPSSSKRKTHDARKRTSSSRSSNDPEEDESKMRNPTRVTFRKSSDKPGAYTSLPDATKRSQAGSQRVTLVKNRPQNKNKEMEDMELNYPRRKTGSSSVKSGNDESLRFPTFIDTDIKEYTPNLEVMRRNSTDSSLLEEQGTDSRSQKVTFSDETNRRESVSSESSNRNVAPGEPKIYETNMLTERTVSPNTSKRISLGDLNRSDRKVVSAGQNDIVSDDSLDLQSSPEIRVLVYKTSSQSVEYVNQEISTASLDSSEKTSGVEYVSLKDEKYSSEGKVVNPSEGRLVPQNSSQLSALTSNRLPHFPSKKTSRRSSNITTNEKHRGSSKNEQGRVPETDRDSSGNVEFRANSLFFSKRNGSSQRNNSNMESYFFTELIAISGRIGTCNPVDAEGICKDMTSIDVSSRSVGRELDDQVDEDS